MLNVHDGGGVVGGVWGFIHGKMSASSALAARISPNVRGSGLTSGNRPAILVNKRYA
jgi:hypothetical protein